MKVSELMSVGVQTVSPGTPAANARERMRTKQIHHLLVKEKDAIVGVLSARDLARAGRRGVVKPRLVSEFMTPRVVTIRCWLASNRRASRTVLRLTPVLTHSSGSGGSRSPGCSRPDVMSARNSSASN